MDPEAAPEQLDVVVDLAAVQHAAGGNARRLQDLHAVLWIALGGPRPEELVELVVSRPSLVEGEVGEVVAAEDSAAGPPLVVAHHGNDDPLLVSDASVGPLRRPS